VPHGVGVRAEEQVAAAGCRQKVMRIAANQSQTRAEFCEKLGRHHAEKVRAGRCAKVWRLREGVFRLCCAADNGLFVEESDTEARPGEEDCRDKSVVPGSNDGNVGGKVHGALVYRN